MFWGSVLWPMGLGILNSCAKQQAGLCPVSGPCRVPWWKLTAAAQLTQLLFGKAMGG